MPLNFTRRQFARAGAAVSLASLLPRSVFSNTTATKKAVIHADSEIGTVRPEFHSHFAEHLDRKSTRLNSSHLGISYAVFCLNLAPTKEIYTLSLHDALPISATKKAVIHADSEIGTVRPEFHSHFAEH